MQTSKNDDRHSGCSCLALFIIIAFIIISFIDECNI